MAYKSNKDVIEAFTSGQVEYCVNAISTGDRLYSYKTIVAKRIEENGKLIILITNEKYSHITTKFVNYLILELDKCNMKYRIQTLE